MKDTEQLKLRLDARLIDWLEKKVQLEHKKNKQEIIKEMILSYYFEEN